MGSEIVVVDLVVQASAATAWANRSRRNYPGNW